MGQWQAAAEEPPQWQAAPRRPPPPSAVLRPLFLLQEGPAEALAACLAPLWGRLGKVLEGSTCFHRPQALGPCKRLAEDRQAGEHFIHILAEEQARRLRRLGPQRITSFTALLVHMFIRSNSIMACKHVLEFPLT